MLIKHYTGTNLPNSSEINLGELVVKYIDDTATLYSKNLDGKVIEIGKGAKSIYDLEDIDFTNLEEGSFIVKQGNKFVAISQIGSLSSLVDVEITDPVDGEYLRYDTDYQAFRNLKPSYSLFELLDVDILDPTIDEGNTQNNQVLYYNHTDQKFKTKNRINTINELTDVAITDIAPSANPIQLLTFDAQLNQWINKPLSIENDREPKLGNNLNAAGYYIKNNSYRLIRKVGDTPTVTCRYQDGDYFVIEGVSTGTNPQCIILPTFSNVAADSTAIMMLEIRQNTGNILIGGLTNAKYEDGKPILLSGNGKTDLVTITHQKYTVNSVVIETNYITLAALNLATNGNGGISAERYDKSRYVGNQLFEPANVYDDYMDYVELLLTFEDEESTGKDWIADKSYYENVTVTNDQEQYDTKLYSLGLLEYASISDTYAKLINFVTLENIVLDEDFTYEYYVSYKSLEDFISETDVTHTYLHTYTASDLLTSNLSIKYIGHITPTSQTTRLELRVDNVLYTYNNAYVYYKYNLDKYIHTAIVREGSTIKLYVDGILQSPIVNTVVSSPATLTINNGYISQKGIINSVRLSKYARYGGNFNIPNLRFGLVGGYGDIIHNHVFATYNNYAFTFDDDDPLNNILAVGIFT